MKKILAVLDYETDPFKHGRIPAPFVCGFYYWHKDKYVFLQFWGSDCVKQVVDFLHDTELTFLIYAHNGGKFDYFFMLEHLENPIKLIGTRIAKTSIGRHELRDSYSIIPVPLSAYAKDTIDYAKMEADVRHLHSAEISIYLKSDCVNLFELVSAFRERFGDKLTVGATAIAELQKYHPFEKQNASHDAYYRKWFFGGRVECFESGILSGDFKIYDVNSMYPHCMKNYQHPTGSKWIQQIGGKLDKDGDIVGMKNFPVYFAEIECSQNGAFPTRIKGQALDFNIPHGVFHVTSHELKAAIKFERVTRITIIRVLFPVQTISFGDYVDTFVAEKVAAKLAKDKIRELFSKFLLNSAYGKFAQNPENYFDYRIQSQNEDTPDSDWTIYMTHICGAKIWRKPASSRAYFDVSTAASITGAARAILLEALSLGKRVVYCDTDSVICERLPLTLSETALGAWKLEGQGDTLAIAGKKLYALRDGKKVVKQANKGALLSDAEIFRVARGGVAHWKSEAPTFSLSNGVSFIDRKIQSSATKMASEKPRQSRGRKVAVV